VLEDVGFQTTPKLSFGDGVQAQMFRKTVPMIGAATLKLRLPSSVAVLGTTRSPRSTEGSAGEIRHRYANVLEKCRTGTSDTVKCKECNLNLIDCFLQVRYLLSPVRLSSVCLTVVCNVCAPYSGGSDFRHCFYGIRYLGHPLTSTENFTEIVPGEPLRRGS